MLVSMPRQSTTICSNGITSEKKSVEGSRRTCSVSLKKTARKPRKRSNTGLLRLRLVLIGQLDEDVFEARLERANFTHGDSVFEKLLAKIVEVEMFFDQRVNRLAENGGAANAGELPGETQSTGDFRGRDFDALGAGGLHVRKLAQRIGSAVGDELAIINVGDVAAALGLVHIVRGDEERDAVAGKLEEQIPELAARDGVDAGGGLVEEKELGLVQHGAAEGEALLPSAGKLRCEPSEVGAEAVELDDFVHAALQAIGRQAIDAPVKKQILRHGKVVVEAEPLRHVADALAHSLGIFAYIQPEDVRISAAQGQQAREHLDHGCF